RRADVPEAILPAATDDDLVSQLVKRLGEALANPRRAAGDKNSVRVHLHGLISTIHLDSLACSAGAGSQVEQKLPLPKMGFPHPIQNHEFADGVGDSLRRASCAALEPIGTMRLLPHFAHP